MSSRPILKTLDYLKKNPSLLLRHGVQVVCALIVVVGAVEFSCFVEALRSGAPETYRPAVVEGFLPVAAIVALRAMPVTGRIDPIHPAGLVILVAALITAFLFRRALCSWICPLGTLSEFLWKTGKKLPGRVANLPKWADWPLLGLKYAAFLFVVKYFFFMDSREAVSFMQTPYYVVSDIKMFDMFAGLGGVGVTVISLLTLCSVMVKAFWCRYLCPYGAVLGVLGLVSPVFLKKDSAICNGCGLCTKVCPNGVTVSKRKKFVFTAECTGCTSCVSRCPRKGALSFRLGGIFTLKPLLFGALLVALFSGAVLWAKATDNWQTGVPFEQYRRFDRIMSK